MAVLKRGAVQAPVLPKETVEVVALGGEVVVRGLLMVEALDIRSAIQDTAATKTNAEAVHAVMPLMLALCVVDADGAALFTADQWQVFGAANNAAAIGLFNVAWRLSGFVQAAETKN